jgi:SAM-dependent methyltransferase
MSPVSAPLAVDYIRRLVAQGGPREEDYPELNAWYARCHAHATGGQLSEEEILDLLDAFGDAMGPQTMQGFVVVKPHGYAGDFEIIDRIYRKYISSDPALARWDHWFHQHAAPRAVRNRKSYFHGLLDELHAVETPRVLKVGIGPGRSMFEWLSRHPDATAVFDCLDIDAAAIAYARELNRPFLDRIHFIQKNCLRYKPTEQYDLIWAAGIFDYFDDRAFQLMVQRLLPAVAPGGELVIGNFADINPSRPYMEFVGAWVLRHRSAAELVRLAEQCGVPRECIRIGCEHQGVNLFLHISPPIARGLQSG